MKDTLERVIADSGNFFGIACRTTDLVNEACRRHDVGPTAAVALARALTGASLLAALLKDGQAVQLKFEGNGPLRKIITEAGYDGWVRGYVAEPYAEVPLKNGQIDVAAGIGAAGLLTVVKSTAKGRRYPGTIALYTSEIGEDLAYYLTQSEQTPAAVALAVQLEADGRVSAAGGYLIQSLPPADEHEMANLEREMATLEPLSTLIRKAISPAEILSHLFQNVPHHTTATKDLSYACSCSRDKMENALLSLRASELRELGEKEGGAEVRCEFCRQAYRFSATEVLALLPSNS